MKLIFDYSKKGHPLGQEIHQNEVPILISKLRNRLFQVQNVLNLSPSSLIVLEEELIELVNDNQKTIISEEEIVEIIREIAAYFGEVLVLHADGKWQPQGSLWNTRVIFKGEIKIDKGGGRNIARSISLSLGNIASSAWESIIMGKRPNLYNEYLSAKIKIHKEKI